MSRTIKQKEFTKHRVKNRKNEYGLCVCASCRAGRAKYKKIINKIKHKFRTEWKTNKKFKKGMFTD